MMPILPTQLHKNRDWLYDAYVNQGKSARAIGRETGIGTGTANAWLNRFGIEIRDRAAATAMSRRTNFFPIDFFIHWSPTLAYAMGFAMADGNVCNSGSQKRLTFHSTDKCIIESIANAIGWDGPIYEAKPQQSHWLPCWSIQLNHPELPAILTRYGLVPNKSLIAEMPDVPAGLLGHYVRGLFDGDGCVYWTNNRAIVPRLIVQFCSASRVLLPKLMKSLNDVGLPIRPIENNGNRNAFYLRYTSTESVLQLYKLLYTGAGNLYLPRKIDRFHHFFKSVVDNIDTPPPAFRMPLEMRYEISSLLDAAVRNSHSTNDDSVNLSAQDGIHSLRLHD